MIRPATLEDLPILLALGELMHAESPRFSRMTFSQARLGNTLASLINLPTGFLWVAESKGEVVGGMAAIATQHWASDDLLATDLALFVSPEHRGGIFPARLIQKYRVWARDEIGATIIQVGVTTGVATEAAARLYERLGFDRCGVILEDANVHRC